MFPVELKFKLEYACFILSVIKPITYLYIMVFRCFKGVKMVMGVNVIEVEV